MRRFCLFFCSLVFVCRVAVANYSGSVRVCDECLHCLYKSRRSFRRRLLAFVSASLLVLLGGTVSAGTGSGTIGQMIVGRMGNQVYVQLLNPSIINFPCASPHSIFHFAFLITNSGGKEMLATLLAARASGQSIYLVGAGTCNVDPQTEDVSYVWVL